ncbi:MAG: LCP family protein [Thermosynechococcaceae cyanobacterium]
MIRSVNSSAGRSSGSQGRVKPSESSSRSSVGSAATTLPLRSGPWRWVGWSFAFAGVITVSASLGATLALLGPFQLSLQPGLPQSIDLGNFFKTGFQYGVSRPVNILVMGIDQGMDTPESEKTADVLGSRSDTMLLVRLNPETRKVSLLTIPRDTQVNIPGIGVSKINAANWKGGPDMAAAVVSQTLNGVPVDRYARISTLAFKDLVDVAGGVEVFVPRAMKYDDHTQNLHIDLKPGLQTLNGQQAEGFVRFRHDDLGDIGRTQRQQMLLKALQKKFQNPLMLARLPQIFAVLQKHIDSNLSLGEMLALVQFGMQIKPDQLQMVMLPGRFSTPDEFELSYWLMDPTAMSRVMKTYFEVDPVVADAFTSSGEGTDVASADFANVNIVIQNASGEPDSGNQMADYLQQKGFFNVSVDNDWPQTLATTQIVPQWGNLEAADHLKQTLESSEVTADSTGDLRSDITIRVGSDWARHHTPPGSAP